MSSWMSESNFHKLSGCVEIEHPTIKTFYKSVPMNSLNVYNFNEFPKNETFDDFLTSFKGLNFLEDDLMVIVEMDRVDDDNRSVKLCLDDWIYIFEKNTFPKFKKLPLWEFHKCAIFYKLEISEITKHHHLRNVSIFNYSGKFLGNFLNR